MAPSAVMALHGELLFRVGTIVEAGDVLGASLALDPSNADARVAMARVTLALGDRTRGLDALKQVASSAPASFAAQYYLGGMLAVDRNYAEAFRCFDAAIRLRPGSVPGLYAFSTVALALGLDDAAEEAMQAAMRLESNPEAYRLRAYTALALRRDTVAARDALRYIDSVGWRDAEAAETAFVAAIANLRSQRRDEAAAILERVRASVSASSWAAAVVDFLEGRIGGERLLGLARDVEQQTDAHTYIGLAASLAGRGEEARAHFQWVKNAGTRRELEYGVAIEELVRIETERRQQP
jgi:tetratricopeptide (TPR) repeat protein